MPGASSFRVFPGPVSAALGPALRGCMGNESMVEALDSSDADVSQGGCAVPFWPSSGEWSGSAEDPVVLKGKIHIPELKRWVYF